MSVLGIFSALLSASAPSAGLTALDLRSEFMGCSC
jgi:hypothetical protein